MSLRRLVTLASLACATVVPSLTHAQEIITDRPKEKVDLSAPPPARLAWWTAARYGMFVHWGAYAVAGRGEWVMNRERIPVSEYREKYVQNFRAENYDPRAWARLAKDAGMGYVVLTAKHHDGFCLWDTQTTDYNAVNLGPKRDLIRPYVEALRAEGLKVGLYLTYADWSRPEFPGIHQRSFARKWPEGTKPETIAGFQKYVEAQLTELLTNYGKIDILWWDAAVPRPVPGKELNDLARKLQPDILINDRLDNPGDFATSEQSVKAAARPWETCMTLTPQAWGYQSSEYFDKGPKEVLDHLLNTSGNGGNFLINIGPRADGSIPQQAQDTLRTVGSWLARNREFLPDSGRQPFSWVNWGRYTVKGNKVYAHLLHDTGGELTIADIANPVKRVSLLDGGHELPFEKKGDRLFIRGLPQPIDPVATTVVIEVEGAPEQQKP